MDFATILKDLRESREITQNDLARQLKVSRPTIAGYETKHRQPDFDKLIVIADFFHVSVDYLLTGKETSAIECAPHHRRSERLLEQQIQASLKSLSYDSKEAVLEYIELQKLKEKYKDEKE